MTERYLEIYGEKYYGTVRTFYMITGRGGCVEKVWEKEDYSALIFEDKERAEKKLIEIREKDFDGKEVGKVEEVVIIAKDPIHYSHRYLDKVEKNEK